MTWDSSIGLRGFFETPLVVNHRWTADSVPLDDIKQLQKLFGELNYITGLSRPDAAFAVNKVARLLNKPTKEVYRAAKRTLAYLVGSADLALKYTHSDKKKWQLTVYSDSSFADVSSDKFKSTGGYLVYLEGNLVSWKSKKLKFVCTNTGEAEYLAAYVAMKEALFISFIVLECFGRSVFPIVLYCDNKAVMDILNKSGPGEMTKYMATKFLRLQQWVSLGYVEVRRIESKKNPADGLTKVSKDFGFFKKMVLQPRGDVSPKWA